MRKQLGVWKQGMKGEMENTNVTERSEGAAGGQKCDRAQRGSGRGCGNLPAGVGRQKGGTKKTRGHFRGRSLKKTNQRDSRAKRARGRNFFGFENLQE